MTPTHESDDPVLCQNAHHEVLQSRIKVLEEALKKLAVFVTHSESGACKDGQCSACDSLDIIDLALQSGGE